MRDFVTIGSTPCDEPCACVGEEDYHDRAVKECRRFIKLLRETFGPEPDGARLSIEWFPHDFGNYAEVVCYFNTDIPESVDYAYRCEDDAPTTWKGNDTTKTSHCDNCGKTWTEVELRPIHDFWRRVEPGGVVPIGECADDECGALCYPPYGYVHNLKQQLNALRDILTRLLEWEQFMGGFEDAVWEEARSARRRWQRTRRQ